MANLRGRPNARSRRKIKGRRRKLNIAALVYKFLSLGGRPGDPRTPPAYDQDTAHSPKRRKELRHSLNSQVAGTRNMVNKRKESNKNSKAHRIKRGYTDRDAAKSSCMCKRGGEGIDRMKMYIQKALDFGVESGYLIPKDTAYKVLRVSSDLVSDGNYVRDGRNSDRAVSRDRDRSPHRTQIKLDDYGVQEPCKS
ncbi:uncharacterized protein LOC116427345, partial [Nomia melanderi]|uniref:uncharacterized protein LOC116427345 n=1 Tax=Nomia melanderi TaxID=2448451 RepID=UPI003FCE03E2